MAFNDAVAFPFRVAMPAHVHFLREVRFLLRSLSSLRRFVWTLSTPAHRLAVVVLVLLFVQLGVKGATLVEINAFSFWVAVSFEVQLG